MSGASLWSTWYNASFSRSRGPLRTPAYLARETANNNTPAPMAAASIGGAIVIDMEEESKGKEESLFGPSIGIVNTGPEWTALNEKRLVEDELTQDVVKGWVEKSQSGTQPATTLQALVNLKRPTLRLSPLAPLDSADTSHHALQHGISFSFDCDSPQCGIYIYAMIPATHPDSPLYKGENSSEADANAPLTKVLLYEQVTDGGFGKVLDVEDGAAIELSRFLPSHKQSKPQNPEGVDSSSSLEPPSDSSTHANEDNSAGNRARRFTHFHLRRSIFHSSSDADRQRNRAASGPALAVVDTLDPSNQALHAEDEGSEVKLMIRLAALDDQGTELSLPNEQVTFLSVARHGPKVSRKATEDSAANAEPAGEASNANADEATGDNTATAPKPDDEDEDTRPWVVRVVKREATIGPHTFQLHEIYGLASHSVKPVAPPVPTAAAPSSPTSASQTHTYPPAATTAGLADDESEDCLLCLSSPREVVLLPCRHLVACKECAINMVEYGAGGALNVSSSEPAAGVAGVGAGGGAEGENVNGESGQEGGNAADAVVPAPPPLANVTEQRRRKRRAKGWFCPVCRQPYTSLLRISTSAPPPPAPEGDAAPSSPNQEDDSAAHAGSGNAMRNLLRPQFLRAFSRPGGNVNGANAASAPIASANGAFNTGNATGAASAPATDVELARVV
ncbi:hypothetical protein FB107DRAFT_250161 [Schizophyllum commune]